MIRVQSSFLVITYRIPFQPGLASESWFKTFGNVQPLFSVTTDPAWEIVRYFRLSKRRCVGPCFPHGNFIVLIISSHVKKIEAHSDHAPGAWMGWYYHLGSNGTTKSRPYTYAKNKSSDPTFHVAVKIKKLLFHHFRCNKKRNDPTSLTVRKKVSQLHKHISIPWLKFQTNCAFTPPPQTRNPAPQPICTIHNLCNFQQRQNTTPPHQSLL